MCVAKLIDVKSAVPDQLPRGHQHESPRRAWSRDQALRGVYSVQC